MVDLVIVFKGLIMLVSQTASTMGKCHIFKVLVVYYAVHHISFTYMRQCSYHCTRCQFDICSISILQEQKDLVFQGYLDLHYTFVYVTFPFSL